MYPKSPSKHQQGYYVYGNLFLLYFLLHKIWTCAIVRPPQQQKLTLYTILLKLCLSSLQDIWSLYKRHSLIFFFFWLPLNNKNTLLCETHKLDPLRRGAASREPLVFLCQYRETYNISDKVTHPHPHPSPLWPIRVMGKVNRDGNSSFSSKFLYLTPSVPTWKKVRGVSYGFGVQVRYSACVWFSTSCLGSVCLHDPSALWYVNSRRGQFFLLFIFTVALF